jgi:hypothetical protein
MRIGLRVLDGAFMDVTLGHLRKGLASLAIIVSAALVFPAVVGRTVLTKAAFDEKPRRMLDESKPQFVVIGDSMCRSRVEETELERLTGRQVVDLAQNGSSSARWYLIFKNYLVASSAQPRMTFFFFRDTVLTEPAHRTSGKYRRELEEAMTDHEPVVDALLSKTPATGVAAWQQWLSRIYPVRDRQTAVREVTEERLLQIASVSLTRDGLRQRLSDTFDITRLRQDVPSDLASQEEEEMETFDPSPNKSFLPHIIALSKSEGLPICFVRVKRSKHREAKWLDGYLADLQAYLQASGVHYYDENTDAEITPQMFSDGDHIDRRYRPFVTGRLYSRLPALFQ